MVYMIAGQFEKLNPLKMKPEVVQKEKKFFLYSPGKKQTFFQS